MKVKLLKKIRRTVQGQVGVSSITTGSHISGISYWHNGNYPDLSIGCYSEFELMEKAYHLYWERNRELYIKKYRKL